MTVDRACTLVPYFDVPQDQMDAFKALGPKFVERTRNEPGCLHYAFSFNRNIAHCREGYDSAESVLAHLANVDDLLKQALSIAYISRIEVHGPAAELDKLRVPLAGLRPDFFVLEEGGFRR